MLLIVTVTLSLQIALCVLTLVSDEADFEGGSDIIEPHRLIIVNAVTLGLSTISLIFIIYLLAFHSWLIYQGRTTFGHVSIKQNRSSSKVVTKVINEEQE